jgi:DNA modification methylase
MTDVLLSLQQMNSNKLRLKPRDKDVSLSNGIRNQIQTEDEPIHDWYRFVLSFPPHLVREYLHRFSINSSHTVLDPFCGTGTTLVECKKLGIPSIGIEAHPMPHFAASVKVDWSVNPQRLIKHAEQIANMALQTLEAQGIIDNPLLFTKYEGDIDLEVLPPKKYKLLIKDSISPVPLHKTLVLLRTLEENANPEFTLYEKLALAKSLITSIGNLHFGPEVGVGKIKQDTPVVTTWLHQVKRMTKDLISLNSSQHQDSIVHLADSRDIQAVLPDKQINAVFTSPPYPNEKDYTRTTRLESVILGFLDGKKRLRDIKGRLLRSNTRNIYKDDDDEKWIETFPEILELAENIEKRRIELGKTSGFEKNYHRVTKNYFGGMYRHFAELRDVLLPGALLGYVVGDQASYLRVMIRTGKILSTIAESLGYEVLSIDLFRTRLATATKEELREEVLILRWPG